MEGIEKKHLESLSQVKALIQSSSKSTTTTPGTDDIDSQFRSLLARIDFITARGLGNPSTSDWFEDRDAINQILKLARQKFYEFPYKDVPAEWRVLYADASIVKTCGTLLNFVDVTDARSEGVSEDELLDELVRILDMAIIMAGAGDEDRREVVDSLLDALAVCCQSKISADERPSKRRRVDEATPEDKFPHEDVWEPPVRNPIRKVSQLSLEAFVKHMRSDQDGPEPLVIQNSIDHWPALSTRPWSKPSYFLSKTIGGRRLVPVELGRSYVDDGWGQKIIPFKEFMNTYLLGAVDPPNLSTRTSQAALYFDGCEAQTGSDVEFPEDKASPSSPSTDHGPPFNNITASATGYLAQHDLFAQIPSLHADILTPDYCWTSPQSPHTSFPLQAAHASLPILPSPLLNAWFGPAETISPLHVDPYHNILAQVVGQKYIRLYAPCETENLYPRGRDEILDVDMQNTSQVDVGVMEGWDGTDEERREALERWGLWSGAGYVDVLLKEGECLYIPLGWWHYVRSLSVSFSVSFWWN